nr:MAG TPA: hypothetical protein [Caudoviricetes sp.]
MCFLSLCSPPCPKEYHYSVYLSIINFKYFLVYSLFLYIVYINYYLYKGIWQQKLLGKYIQNKKILKKSKKSIDN